MGEGALCSARFVRRSHGKAGDRVYAYCLFCDTQRCRSVARLLELRGMQRAFSPQIVQRQRKQGRNLEKRYDLLPGYVFAFADVPFTGWAQTAGIEGLRRRLGRAEDLYALQGADREFALRLYQLGGVIDPVRAFRCGDKVTLADSLFSQAEGQIVEMDRRKARVKIMYRFHGADYFTWAACDWMDRAEDEAVGPPA